MNTIIYSVLGVGGLLLLALVIWLARGVGKRRAAKKAQAQAAPAVGADAAKAPEARDPYFSAAELRLSFDRAVRTLKSSVAGRDFRHDIPWTLMIGPAAAGKSTLLQEPGLQPVLKGVDDERAADLKWWFLERGIILDVPGRYVLAPDGGRVDARPWETLLGQLLKHRPRRPIDAAVVAIPWAEFAGKPDLFRLRRLAEQLYERLWSAQRHLGINFPVYVIVTKTDRARGFKSLCEAIPGAMSQDAFGWSSPYALAAAFNPEWADEALEEVRDNLQHVQQELLAEGREISDPDAFFMFPAEFSAIREPLRLFLDILFRRTVYHESFFFRGLFFTGDASAERLAGAVMGTADEPARSGEGPSLEFEEEDVPAGSSLEMRPWFVTRLLEEKVFAEFGLARPALGAFQTRSRTVRACQALLVAFVALGGFFLWRAGQSAAEYAKGLAPPLKLLHQDLGQAETDQRDRPGAAPSLERFSETARHLVSATDAYHKGRAWSWVVPTSWVSRVSGRTERALATAYGRLLIRPLLERLNERAVELTGPAASPPVVTPRPCAIIAECPAFKAIMSFVDRVDDLERHATLYNDQDTSRDPKGLVQVVRYAYGGVDLPSALSDEKRSLYRSALDVSRPVAFDFAAYAPGVESTLRNKARIFYEQAFDHNLVLQLLERIRKGVGDVPGSEAPADERFDELLDLFESAEGQLGDERLGWLEKDEFEPGPELNALLERVHGSGFLEPQRRDEMLAEAKTRFLALRRGLAEARTDEFSSLLAERDGKVVLNLGPGVEAFRLALAGLLAQPFMKRCEVFPVDATITTASRIMWDTSHLQRGADMLDGFERFVLDGVKAFPPRMQQSVIDQALGRLECNVGGAVVRALRVEPRLGGMSGLGAEDDVAGEVKVLRDSGPLLVRMVDVARKRRLVDFAQHLDQIVSTQGTNLMRALDAILERDNVYDPSLASWDGMAPAAIRIFEVVDKVHLNEYLEVQRGRIARLARSYAQPVLAIVGGIEPEARFTDPLLGKWEKIVASLDRYEKMTPGNSVAALEQFIRTDLAEVTLGDCFKRMAEADGAAHGDFFELRSNELRRGVRQRCQDLAEEAAGRAYADLRDLFNRDLAGAYPFVARGAPAGLSAEPAAVRAFMARFDGFQGTYLQALRSSERYGPSRFAAVTFLEQMAAVRGLLASYLDNPDRSALPAFDVLVDFRVNRARESGSDRIIDWVLRSGPTERSPRQPRAPLRWIAGDPVEVVLRWAKDSPTFPVEGGRARVDAAERTAHFTYRTGWALLELMREHAVPPGELNPQEEIGSAVLLFAVPTQTPTGGAVSGPREELAKVYLRLKMFAPEGKDLLTLPTLPVEAPALETRPAAQAQAGSARAPGGGP